MRNKLNFISETAYWISETFLDEFYLFWQNVECLHTPHIRVKPYFMKKL